MKQKTAAVLAITVFSCFGLLTMPMNADAGRFRGGNMTQTQSATRAGYGYMHAGQQGPGIGFVDADGDGINDNFVDADGDGICDNTGLPVGSRGMGFVDADGDGINDNFVDLNGDGICDLRQ
jgi:hypothetical protein